jgi:hypothetical protein
MPRKSHYASTKRYNLTCPICEARFVATRKDARYCGPACRQQISRAARLVMAAAKAISNSANGPSAPKPRGAQQK